VRAQIVEGIDRQECAIENRGIGNSVRQPELMHDTIDLPDTMPTVSGLAQVETVEMRQRDYGVGLSAAMLNWRKPYDLRLKTWAPEQGLPIGWSLRIGRKIEAPSAVRRLPAVLGPVCSKR